MLRGSGRQRRPLQAVDPRDALELSGVSRQLGDDRRASEREGVGRQQLVAVRQRRRHRADQRLEARRRRPAGSSRSPGAPAGAAGPSPRPARSGGSLSQPSEPMTTIAAAHARCRGARPAAPCTFVAIRVPPNRSVTRAVACSIGAPRPTGARSTGVSRVSVVANANTSASATSRERPHQVQVGGGLRLHRLADVAEHDHPARPADRRDPDQLDRLPAGTPGPGDAWGAARSGRPRGVGRAPPATGGSARPAAPPRSQRAQQPPAAPRSAARTAGRPAPARSLGSRCGHAERAVGVLGRRPPPAAASPTAARRRRSARPPRARHRHVRVVAVRRRGPACAAACGSTSNAASSNTASKTASNAARSACRRTRRPGRSSRARHACPAARRASARAKSSIAGQPDRHAALPQPDGERDRERRPVDAAQQRGRAAAVSADATRTTTITATTARTDGRHRQRGAWSSRPVPRALSQVAAAPRMPPGANGDRRPRCRAVGVSRRGDGASGRAPRAAGTSGRATQLAFEALDELAEQLRRHLLDHAAAELGQLAGDLQVGVDGDHRAVAVGAQLRGDQRRRVARPRESWPLASITAR